LATDLAQANLDFSLWKGTQGDRRISTVHSQEAGNLIILRVKVPHWRQATEIDVQVVANQLLLSLEQRDHVVVPGYCDFNYSPEQLRTSIKLPDGIHLYRIFWETTSHIATIIFTKELTAGHDHRI
jgi:HSP20 family molecular chaperone IbpA